MVAQSVGSVRAQVEGIAGALLVEVLEYWFEQESRMTHSPPSANLAATLTWSLSLAIVRLSRFRFAFPIIRGFIARRAVCSRAAACRPRPLDSCWRFRFALRTRDSHVRDKCNASALANHDWCFWQLFTSSIAFFVKYNVSDHVSPHHHFFI